MNLIINKIKLFPKFLLIILVILLGARLALPYAMVWYINKSLHSMSGYDGYISDVSVSLWRGAYRIDGLNTIKFQDKKRMPFLTCKQIEIALQWQALLQRRIVAKIKLIHPEFQLYETASKEETIVPDKQPWQQEVKKLVPILINQFSIIEGSALYIDENSSPKINLALENINLIAENLSNTKKLTERLPSSFHLDGQLLKSGKLEINAKLNPFSEPVEAFIKSSVRGLKLHELNNFAKAYGDFDFKDGFFDGTIELALTKTNYNGYFKTLFKKVKILDWTKERRKGATINHLLWEGLINTVIDVFKNGKKDQFASRIPIEGSRKEMEVNKWKVFVSILRNGFIEALSNKFENSVKIPKFTQKPLPHKKKDAKK